MQRLLNSDAEDYNEGINNDFIPRLVTSGISAVSDMNFGIFREKFVTHFDIYFKAIKSSMASWSESSKISIM